MTLTERVDEAIMVNIVRSDDKHASAKAAIQIVLEEAAKVVEDRPSLESWELAAAIRALAEDKT